MSLLRQGSKQRLMSMVEHCTLYYNCLSVNFTASNELHGPALQNLRKQLKQYRYLIIEMPMIGRRQLGMIHQRLCQARPDHAMEPFNGLSLILVRDFGQLPPVGDTPLYVADGILTKLDLCLLLQQARH